MFYHSYYNKKSVESYLLSIPHIEALPLPNPVEQTTSEAHADMNIHFAVRDLYKQHDLYPKWYNPCLQGLTGLIDIITPGTSTVATFKTGFRVFGRFRCVSNTASSKRL